MDSIDFQRSKSLNIVPKRKIDSIIESIRSSKDDLKTQSTLINAINKYAESNIPIEYWRLSMDKHFQGDKRLLAKYKEYTSDLKKAFLNGESFCLCGSHGLGKSLVHCCILKEAVLKNYTCLYTTLSDIVNVLLLASSEEKFLARRELTLVDFLVIDEFDSRFMPTEAASDLYARSLEGIFRTRVQNHLPTLMATNSPNILNALSGPMQQSMGSLMKGYLKMFPVLGSDFREKKQQ